MLHDLTRANEGRAEHLLEQADAVVVLGRSDLPSDVVQFAPGLNRGYSAVVEKLGERPGFSTGRASGKWRPARAVGLCEALTLEQAGETSKSETRRRR